MNVIDEEKYPEAAAIWRRHFAGYSSAHGELAMFYQPFLEFKCREWCRRSRVHYRKYREDLMGEGQIALLRSLDGFKLEFGVRFTSYAGPAMERAFFDWQFFQRHGTKRWRVGEKRTFSLDALENPQNHTVAKERQPHDLAAERELVEKALNAMDAGQRRRTIAYYFGRGNYRDIGEEEGVTGQAVQQTVWAGLDRAREAIEARQKVA